MRKPFVPPEPPAEARTAPVCQFCLLPYSAALSPSEGGYGAYWRRGCECPGTRELQKVLGAAEAEAWTVDTVRQVMDALRELYENG